jgi:SAM-dependent methyltransferase
MNSLLHDAEELESGAAAERVALFERLGVPPGPLLDVGCGNGHSVAEWRRLGRRAYGVDYELYRLTRWVEVHRPGQPLVVADARALPFRAGTFVHVVSSGMLEHIGVSESPSPYTVTAWPNRHACRSEAVSEMTRVVVPGGHLTLDFPNGRFPIDFWHGDRVGAFRIHGVPDALNPTVSALVAYAGVHTVTVLPVGTRLRFRQISQRWWGRLLGPLARAYVATLDAAPGRLGQWLRSWLSPFLLVRIATKKSV